MKHEFDLKTMAPEPVRAQFFPQFRTLSVEVDGKPVSAKAVLEVGDRNDAVLKLKRGD